VSLEISHFERIFIDDIPLIDTRSPGEFAKGSFPCAHNLPLMTDDERAQIGTCYKYKGQQAAIELGHQLVSGETKAQRVASWQAFATDNPEGALFCWRGGLRSEITQSWLAEVGISYPRIQGGYKALRRWLLETFERLCSQHPLLVIGGKTGCAKTRLLQEGQAGRPFSGSVDLEGLANHRGSAFGRRLGGQPTQLAFEIALAIAFLKASKNQPGPILIEDESRLIGRCALPPILQEAKKSAPMVLLNAPLEARVEHSFENYILANLREIEAQEPASQIAFERFSNDLLNALDRVRKRLGGDRHKQLYNIMLSALHDHQRGDPSGHKRWIRVMLEQYYDPMYNYQLEDRRHRIVFEGDHKQVADYLRTLYAHSKSA